MFIHQVKIKMEWPRYISCPHECNVGNAIPGYIRNYFTLLRACSPDVPVGSVFAMSYVIG